jgi:hypothetical protein
VVTLESRGYDVGVEFDIPINGHDIGGVLPPGSQRGLYVWASRIEYVGVATDTDKTTCSRCGCVITDNVKLGARLFKDMRICDDCVTRIIGETHSYHYGKGLSYAYAKDKITMGVEIEIDDGRDEGDRDAVIDDVIKYARDKKYSLIMSHETDGSLDGYGFESVTAPLTLDEWKSDEVLEQLDTLFYSADENGFRFEEDDHAGLHVHIGREDLCGSDRNKSDAVGLLMGWAVARLWDKGFARLSRRRDTDFCHLFDEYGRGSGGLYDTSAAEHDRYYAVNISNSKTIELRIFKGACCVEDVLLAVDMCYMLAKWSTKKIEAFSKRNTYSARSGKFDDALAYADRLTWDALVKYSKFPNVTLKAMRRAGIKV